MDTEAGPGDSSPDSGSSGRSQKRSLRIKQEQAGRGRSALRLVGAGRNQARGVNYLPSAGGTPSLDTLNSQEKATGLGGKSQASNLEA